MSGLRNVCHIYVYEDHQEYYVALCMSQARLYLDRVKQPGLCMRAANPTGVHTLLVYTMHLRTDYLIT